MIERFFMHLGAFGLPIGLALLMLNVFVVPWQKVESPERFVSTLPTPASAQLLQQRFDALGYAWPPAGPLPALALKHFPQDMVRLEPAAKKQLFFRSLAPLVALENGRIRHERERLLGYFAEGRLREGSARWRWTAQRARDYRVEGDLNDARVRQRLLRRVDGVPAGLALAQAANESAWGTSRFAREGNNLFGQWTWQRDAGLLPRERAERATHFVRKFPDLQGSVRAYIHNINVGHAYGELRQMREAMRMAGEPLDPVRLAAGLLRYSERGAAYVDEIQDLIRANELHLLAPLILATQ